MNLREPIPLPKLGSQFLLYSSAPETSEHTNSSGRASAGVQTDFQWLDESASLPEDIALVSTTAAESDKKSPTQLLGKPHWRGGYKGGENRRREQIT